MNTRLSATILALLLALAACAQPAPTKRILAPLFGWEHGTWNGQFTDWFAACTAGGYTVDTVEQAPALSGAELLARYDAVVMTTRSSYAGVLTPQFQATLAEFVRQGGGVILVATADQYRWMHQPVALMLPTTFYLPGPGWGTAAAAHGVHPLPAAAHPITQGLDWATAPALPVVYPVYPPSHEIFRGALALLAPRELLRKPLLNGGWVTLLRADDTEQSPLAVAGSYGRGRVVVWGLGLGGDPNRADVPAPFTRWAGFAPLWRQCLAWVAAGKAPAPQPGVWVFGDARDTPAGKAWSGQAWAFPQAISYALPEFGLSHLAAPAGAAAALVLQADPAQDAALAALAADHPVLVCDPTALDGALKGVSPLRPDAAVPLALPPLTLGTAAPKLPPPPAQAAAPAPLPLPDPALQPPAQWQTRTTNSVTFQRDLDDVWYAPAFDDRDWETAPLGTRAQLLGGAQVPCTGAVWYRAQITLPAAVPADAVWTFATRVVIFRAQLRAWVDGVEVPLDGFSLRLAPLKVGKHLLVLRLYNAGGGSYWVGSRELYTNAGLTGVKTELRPATPAVAPS